MSKWYSGQGNNSDVVLSSKIRLARNLQKVPFPCRMSNEIRKSVCKKIFAALQNSSFAGEFDLIELSNLSDMEKIALAEKGFISPEMAQQNQYSAVLLSKDESCSIMLCEEDHIRLSVMHAGEDLKAAYKKADAIDDVFIKSMKIAFSDKLGFLTSNPMHLGTGMKASVALHLPAISERNMIGTLSAMVGKLGFSIGGHLGCSDCYDKFGDKLEPSIRKIHGKTKHIGKFISYDEKAEPEKEKKETKSEVSEIDALKEQLQTAINEQRFEDAAVLRDKIKDLTEGKNE